jgi:mono/diheme cytochrome c family protein
MRKPWYTYLYTKSPVAKILWGIATVIVSVGALTFIWAVDEPRMQAQTANWAGRSVEKGAEIFANNCSSCHGLAGEGGAGPALNSRYFFTQRLVDVGWAGSLRDFIELTVAAGRPANTQSQWSVIMPTWSVRFGGPLRDDQIEQVTNYVLNWEKTALLQTDAEDPFIPFVNAPSKAAPVDATQPITPATALREPQVLFVQMTCNACHQIDQDQTADNRGPIAPYLGNLYETAGDRVPGQSAEEYVHTSIVEPNAFVVESYFPGIMPQDFAQRMAPQEIDDLVAWLLNPNKGQ